MTPHAVGMTLRCPGCDAAQPFAKQCIAEPGHEALITLAEIFRIFYPRLQWEISHGARQHTAVVLASAGTHTHHRQCCGRCQQHAALTRSIITTVLMGPRLRGDDSVVMRFKPGMTNRRRPRERGDPYTPSPVLRKVSATCGSNSLHHNRGAYGSPPARGRRVVTRAKPGMTNRRRPRERGDPYTPSPVLRKVSQPAALTRSIITTVLMGPRLRGDDSVVMRVKPGMTNRRRPRERGDPYTPSPVLRKVSATCGSNSLHHNHGAYGSPPARGRRVVTRAKPGMTNRRRPRERGDPYTPSPVLRKVSATCGSNSLHHNHGAYGSPPARGRQRRDAGQARHDEPPSSSRTRGPIHTIASAAEGVSNLRL